MRQLVTRLQVDTVQRKLGNGAGPLRTNPRADPHAFNPPEWAVQLSNNECSLPPPEPVLAAIRAAVGASHRYPDNNCSSLRQVLADQFGITPEGVIVGAGSCEVLIDAWHFAVSTAPAETVKAVFAVPGFPLYEMACNRSGACATKLPLTIDGCQDLQSMADAANDPATRIIVVCNPHNPTGGYVSDQYLRRLVDTVPSHVLVIVDEAYQEFADAADFAQTVTWLSDYPTVLVTRTFSKAYGLAGLRVGYGLGHPELIGKLCRISLPYTVSTAAQAGALAWLKYTEELQTRMVSVRLERARLADGLMERGFTVLPSQANFVFIEDGSLSFAAALLEHGVSARPAGHGVRVTVGSSGDHDRLFKAIDHLRADGFAFTEKGAGVNDLNPAVGASWHSE
jgi:histidinol-phosphate aminotransferase